MSDFSLQPYGIVRPEKIRWNFPVQGNVLDSIPSNSLRKFLRESRKLLEVNEIFVSYQVVDDRQYASWYDFYSQNMKEKGYDLLATKNLLDEKRVEGKSVEGIFLFKESKMIGGGIIVRRAKDWASLAFKASINFSLGNKKNSSLGSVIDFLFLDEMFKQGVASISGGRSRNAFGVINSFSHLEYKLRMGYVPVPDEESLQVMSVPLNGQGAVAFVGLQSGKAILFFLKMPGVRIDFDYKKLSTFRVPFQEIGLS